MAEEHIHRQSVSRSIQYSDYSSGDDYQPEPRDIQPNEHEETEDDDDSSSSSSYAPIIQPKQIEKKRTSATIQSKLNTINKKFQPSEPNDNDINNNKITSQAEKKAELTAKWQRLIAANSSDNKKLHESQKVIKPKNIHSIHDGHGIGQYGVSQYTNVKRKKSGPPQKVVLSPTKVDINNSNPYDGLTPVQIWNMKKTEREKNNNIIAKDNIENDKNKNKTDGKEEFEDFAAELKRQKMEEMKENNNTNDEKENIEIINNESNEKDETLKTEQMVTENVENVENEIETVEIAENVENDASQM